METNLSEVLRITFIVILIAGFAWTMLTIREYYQVGEGASRLLRMLHRLGIEARSLGEWPLEMYRPTAVRLCHYCPYKAECDAWAAQKGKATAPPAFCANANAPQLIAALPWMRAG